MSFSSLTPMYGLGSGARTAASILMGSPRTKLGSQGRCYAYAKNHGYGPQYIQLLINSLGPQPNASARWSIY